MGNFSDRYRGNSKIAGIGVKAAPPAVPAPPKVRHITSWIRRRSDNLDVECPEASGQSIH